jgi:hypothetical protein
VLKGLQDHQPDLGRHHLIGSSGGALLATLAAAGVEPAKAIELALQLTEGSGGCGVEQRRWQGRMWVGSLSQVHSASIVVRHLMGSLDVTM